MIYAVFCEGAAGRADYREHVSGPYATAEVVDGRLLATDGLRPAVVATLTEEGWLVPGEAEPFRSVSFLSRRDWRRIEAGKGKAQ